MKSAFGVLSALLVIIGTIPYLVDILKKRSKPARSTWTLLTLLLLIQVFVQHDIGVGWALALTIGEVVACGSVFLLSVPYGVGGFDRRDIFAYVLWGVMVACWLGFNAPIWALHFGIMADAASLLPTFHKSWQEPHEESKSVFIFSALAGLLGVLAAKDLSYVNVIFSAYLFLINAGVALTIVLAERRDQSADAVTGS